MYLGKLNIWHTTDETDCETCGASWAEAYEIEYQGNTYGFAAYAGCFDQSDNSLVGVLIDIFGPLGLADDLDEIPYMDDQSIIEVLESFGFEVHYESD